MPLLSLRLSPEQIAALNEALAAAGLDEQAFVELAVRSLAARYGIEIPPMPASPVHPVRLAPKREGHPLKAAAGKHPMTRDVPAGDFPHVCPVCTRAFRSDDPDGIYCSNECEVSMQNKRQYLRRKKLNR